MSKDLFSKQADTYAKFRPVYPVELYTYILQFVTNRDCVWDCATGNGQAAVALADYFTAVEATDYSEKQVAHAVQKNNITYTVCAAEQTAFAENSFDLITVAQAYHWLHYERFRKEACRVAKPGAILAVWGYNIPLSGNKKLDDEIEYFYKSVVGNYWDKERAFIDESYETIPFDFEELPAKPFFINVFWAIEELTGYLKSWSSVQHYIDAVGNNPVDDFYSQLQSSWPAERIVAFRFPVFLRLGRIGSEK